MSLKNLEGRIEKLERASGGDKPVVLLVVILIASDNAGNREILTPEEEVVLQKYKDETVAAAKPGEGFIIVHWTKDKAQELLAGQDTSSEPTLGEKEGMA
ncbi:MAG: hypothetical protein WC600_03305 [Desulfobaccales bacterium]